MEINGYTIGKCPECYYFDSKLISLHPRNNRLECPRMRKHIHSSDKEALIAYLNLIKADYIPENIDEIIQKSVALKIINGK